MKKIVVLFLVIAIAISFCLPVSAAETLTASLDKESCTVGEYIRVIAAYNGADDLGAFLAEISYDPNSLRYVRTENAGDDYIRTADAEGITRTVYTTQDNGKGELFAVVYKVLPGAEKAELDFAFTGVVDGNGNSMESDISFELSADVVIPSGDALLLDLVPSAGELNEDFSPYTTKYTMSVPYEVKSLTFQVVVSEGAKCSTNRKNLGSGGSTTDFILTVTSEDGKSKNLYTVSATRGEYTRSTTKGTDGSDITGSGLVTDPDLNLESAYETVTPEYTGEDENNENLPGSTSEGAVVTRKDGTAESGGNIIYFLAGAGACLVCIFVGVLITLIFSKTGKHGKH